MKDLAIPHIFIHSLALSFGDHTVFQDISFTIPAGQWTCLLGRSGCGKSTLLKILAGLLKPTAGEIHCSDQAPLTPRIAWMAQSDLLLPWLSALNNAILGARLRGEAISAARDKARQLFARVGLTEKENALPHELSGGMRQRVALIRTLMEDKPIILMDEPFSAVDAITRLELQTLAAELLQNKTVILVTHDIAECARLANTIYLITEKVSGKKYIQQIPTPQAIPPRHIENKHVARCQQIILDAMTCSPN